MSITKLFIEAWGIVLSLLFGMYVILHCLFSLRHVKINNQEAYFKKALHISAGFIVIGRPLHYRFRHHLLSIESIHFIDIWPAAPCSIFRHKNAMAQFCLTMAAIGIASAY